MLTNGLPFPQNVIQDGLHIFAVHQLIASHIILGRLQIRCQVLSIHGPGHIGHQINRLRVQISQALFREQVLGEQGRGQNILLGLLTQVIQRKAELVNAGLLRIIQKLDLHLAVLRRLGGVFVH